MHNVKTCDALWQYVKITISNIGFRWFSNMDLDAGVLKYVGGTCMENSGL